MVNKPPLDGSRADCPFNLVEEELRQWFVQINLNSNLIPVVERSVKKLLSPRGRLKENNWQTLFQTHYFFCMKTNKFKPFQSTHGCWDYFCVHNPWFLVLSLTILLRELNIVILCDFVNSAGSRWILFQTWIRTSVVDRPTTVRRTYRKVSL